MKFIQSRLGMGPHILISALLGFVSLAFQMPQPAHAGRFIALLEAETLEPGVGEVIQVGNWQREKIGEDEISAISMQVGMEFGLASRLHVGMALPAFSDLRSTNIRNTRFGGMSMWGIYNFSNPSDQNLGVSGGMMMTECEENLVMELNLILEKSWDPFVLVMNLTAGHCWVREVDADDHVFLTSRLGISRDIGQSVSLGLESEVILEPGGQLNDNISGIKMGPSVVWNGKSLWVLGGLLFDMHSGSDLMGPSLQLQAGIPF
jgi:hypothetical protein